MRTRIITSFFVPFALFFFSFSVSAKDIYASSTTGVDTNDGLTVGTSVASVARAYALASDGDVIKLDGTFLFGAEISMVKSITIESLSATKAILDGQGKCRFFTLNTLNKNVTLKNLTFQNGSGDNGGAFSFNTNFGRTMNITDCIFDGNKATGQGGVIRMSTYGGTDLLKINRCLFINNISGNHGGVINFTPEGGSQVSNSAVLSISNSTFTHNKNNGGVGGILYVDGSASKWATFNLTNITVSGNSDFGNPAGNNPGFAFIGSTMNVNVNNSIIEGNPLANGNYADLVFSATPTALTVKNSIIGNVTVNGVTVDPQYFAVTESNVNNVKISTDALVAGLGTFNGIYFPLTSASLAYQYGKMSNLASEINADQLAHSRTNSTLTSAGAVNYVDIVSDSKNLNLKSNLLVGKNQITIIAENSKAEVYNLSGILVNSALIQGSATMILKQGIYIVKISSSINKSTSKVIIK